MRPEEGKNGASRRQPAFVFLAPPHARRVFPPEEDAMRADFEISGGGTIYLFRPLTRAAHAWVEEHLPSDATWWCSAIVVEHRFIGPIVGGAIGDGLRVR